MPSLLSNPVHLSLGAGAVVQPEFSGDLAWYEAYGARTQSDGIEGRLVSMFTFGASWDSWEMHPQGSEIVVCVSGEMILIQEQPNGQIDYVFIGPGDYVINQAGIWHTADVAKHCTAIFITAGLGTQHRPR